MLLKSICQKVLYRKVIEQAAAERGITVTPEEVQTEAESIRHKKRLGKSLRYISVVRGADDNRR